MMQYCDLTPDDNIFDGMTDEEIDELYRPMKTNSRKSLAPLFVYLILTKYTNKSKHFTQKDIIEKLKEYPFEIELERKALSRVIHLLADSDLGIICTKNMGVWFEKDAE